MSPQCVVVSNNYWSGHQSMPETAMRHLYTLNNVMPQALTHTPQCDRRAHVQTQQCDVTGTYTHSTM